MSRFLWVPLHYCSHSPYPYTFDSQGDAVEDGHHNTGRVSPFSDPADWHLILFTLFFFTSDIYIFFLPFSRLPPPKPSPRAEHPRPASVASFQNPGANTRHISPATGAALHPTNSASIQHQTVFSSALHALNVVDKSRPVGLIPRHSDTVRQLAIAAVQVHEPAGKKTELTAAFVGASQLRTYFDGGGVWIQ